MPGQHANYQGLSATLLLLLVTAVLVAVGALLHRRAILSGRGPVIAWAVVCAIPLTAAFIWPWFQPTQNIESAPTAGTDLAH